MKTVLTVGVFDVLHIGHILLFMHAKQHGDRLIVAVQDSNKILQYKPNCKVLYSTDERLFMVNSIRYVDEVFVYRDIDKDIMNFDFDIFVKGPDQNHIGFQKAVEWCEKSGKEVITIPRTEGISSSLLKDYLTE